jgi:hypothetical protein
LRATHPVSDHRLTRRSRRAAPADDSERTRLWGVQEFSHGPGEPQGRAARRSFPASGPSAPQLAQRWPGEGSGGAEAIASGSKAGTVRPALPTLLTARRAPSFGGPPAFATSPSKGRRFRISLEIRYDRIYEPYAEHFRDLEPNPAEVPEAGRHAIASEPRQRARRQRTVVSLGKLQEQLRTHRGLQVNMKLNLGVVRAHPSNVAQAPCGARALR